MLTILKLFSYYTSFRLVGLAAKSNKPFKTYRSLTNRNVNNIKIFQQVLTELDPNFAAE